MPVFSPVFCPFFLLKKRPFFARFFIKLSPFEELVTLGILYFRARAQDVRRPHGPGLGLVWWPHGQY